MKTDKLKQLIAGPLAALYPEGQKTTNTPTLNPTVNAQLLAALQEIADRGPLDGYSSAGALRIRLVGTQSIARSAIAAAHAQTAIESEAIAALREITEAVLSMNTSYGTWDFEPGDKSRRYYSAIDSSRAVLARHDKGEK